MRVYMGLRAVKLTASDQAANEEVRAHVIGTTTVPQKRRQCPAAVRYNWKLKFQCLCLSGHVP